MSPRRVLDPSLPASLAALRGRRAARWTRESTGKLDPATGRPKGRQWDNFGPDAQREQQDEAIREWGLVDATIADPTLDFQIAHSGRTVGATTAFGQMLERAGRDFDVLVVGYASRFGRDLRTAINARHDLHERGAVILFADKPLLSSDERDWKAWTDEMVESEAFSRNLGKSIALGLAAKRRRLGEPGGKPPFGFERDGGQPPVLREIPARIELVRAMFHWSAEGLSDREIALRAGLKKSHVAEIITNPFYRGVLRDGSRRPAVIPEGLWAQGAEKRAEHAHRHPGPTTYKQYVWSGLIRCRACRRGLTGHVERYRHVDCCPAFRAARPGAADGRGRGESYKADLYDAIVPRALAHVAANAGLVAAVAEAVAREVAPSADPFTLARIRRERAQATRRLETDRDATAWRVTWDRLDAEEAAAKVRATPPVSAADVARYLADLPGLYAAAGPATKHRIVQALFDQVEVLGPNEIWLYPSLEAETRGWAAAMNGEFRMELRKTGRGERI